MKLATFIESDIPRVGRIEGDVVVDLIDSGLPIEMSAMFATGSDAPAVINTRSPRL